MPLPLGSTPGFSYTGLLGLVALTASGQICLLICLLFCPKCIIQIFFRGLQSVLSLLALIPVPFPALHVNAIK